MVSRRRFVFGLLSALGTGAGLKYFFTQGRQRTSRLPTRMHEIKFNNAPLQVVASSGLDNLVQSERIINLLRMLTPCWNAVKIPKVLHALRLWGSFATFPVSHFIYPYPRRVFTGDDLLRIFLDDGFYQSAAPGGAPLFEAAKGGYRPVYRKSLSKSFAGQLAHNGDFLRVCCDLGLPTKTRFNTRFGECTIADLLTQSILDFHLNQELEWLLEVFLRYLAPQRSWTNRHGEEFTFDQVVETLLDRTPGRGACLGTHVEYSLAVALQIHKTYRLFTPNVVKRIEERLMVTTTLLNTTAIGEQGQWVANWTKAVPKFEKTKMGVSIMNLTSTGHHLEWISIAPDDIRPEISVIQDAALSMLDHVSLLSTFQNEGGYLTLTHFARALCQMKRQSPLEIVFG